MAGTEVVVVGGGVIGLSIAYALNRDGFGVTVLDRAELGRAASWAGAGILAPIAEGPPSSPAGALRSRSARLFPEWSAALLEETGLDNGYRRSGGVDVAWTLEEDHALRAAAGRWKAEGIAFERLEPGEFDRVEPALNPALRSAYFLADRAQIRNPRHVKALVEALTRRGATLSPGRGARGFRVEGDRVVAVETDDGPLPCAWAIVAAGPWSAALLGEVGVRIETPPIKGQIVLLRADRPLLRRIVEHGSHYLVPRDDGRVLVGATEEHAGFDTRPDPASARDLLGLAHRLCPVLAGAEVETTWAGLRPGSADGRPYLGHAPGLANLVIATGHRRAGLQLSPATAEAIADLVAGRPPRVDLSPFAPGREPAASGSDDAFRS